MTAPAPPVLENRLPAEGISSSLEHPLKEFAWLLAAGLVTLLFVAWLIGWGARWLAPKLPFASEVALAERLIDRVQAPADARQSAALQRLADRVAATMALPAGMQIVVQVDPSGAVNAFATIGGRIRVHRGLLVKLRSEDELAALLAHEVAHVKHRHIAASLGRGVGLSLLIGLVSADAGAAVAQAALNGAAELALLGYSREQEREADGEALAALVRLYGHAGGMFALFDRLGDGLGDRPGDPETDGLPAAFSTHPLTAERRHTLRAQACRSGWPLSGTTTPLPRELTLPASATQPRNDPASAASAAC